MTKPDPDELDRLTNFALQLGEAAAGEILPHFRARGAIDNKLSEGFDPVTEADRNAEIAMRRMIEEHFPEHSIHGEEFGIKETGSPWTWILDPVDGTRSFISGMTTWATLIGVEYEGKPVVGVMNQPYVRETFFGNQAASWLRRDGKDNKLAVNPAPSLSEARGGTTGPALYDTPEKAEFLNSLATSLRNIRYDADAYFFCLMAAGHMDIALDTGLQAYDISPLVPIIEGAGGVVSTWDGSSAATGGNILAAASRKLHDEARALLPENLAKPPASR